MHTEAGKDEQTKQRRVAHIRERVRDYSKLAGQPTKQTQMVEIRLQYARLFSQSELLKCRKMAGWPIVDRMF